MPLYAGDSVPAGFTYLKPSVNLRVLSFMKLFTFRKGGIHPPENKDKTENLAIENMPVPSELAILLNQHIGAPAEALVKKGDIVEEGQCIGEVKAGLGTFIHASCKGKVKAIDRAPHPIKLFAPAVIIETESSEDKKYEKRSWEQFSADELIEMVHQAGIVGAGGAGFPVHVKLKPPKDAKITDLVINGAECEPYLTADHRVMLENPEEVIEGIRIMMKILGVDNCFLGIENNKPDAIEKLRNTVKKEDHIQVCALQTKYPQGSEKQLVYALTGRVIGSGALPASVGVVVQNVSTAFSTYEAVVLNKPMYERVLTVSGNGIKRPANLRVRVGTRIRDIVDYLGGMNDDVQKIILGGPMMGFALFDLDVPTTKTASALTCLTEDAVSALEPSACINCAKCVEVCPERLIPKNLADAVENGQDERFLTEYGMECCECGCCSFICPARRQLTQLIKGMRKRFR